MNKIFGLLGYPISHSLSPYIYSSLFKIYNNQYIYTTFEIHPHHIETFFSSCKKFSGYNVTMPYKTLIYNKLKNLDKYAKKFKAVNLVLKLKNNQLKGYNTDGYGFLQTLKQFNISLKGNILILGLGGAGKTIATICSTYGCYITIAVRKASIFKTQNTLKTFFKKNKNIRLVDINYIPKDIIYDIAINATPIGMAEYKNSMPLKYETLVYIKTALDLIYNPTDTKFLKAAASLNIKTVNGLYMLIFQAIKSYEIFTDTILYKNIACKLAEKIKNKLDKN